MSLPELYLSKPGVSLPTTPVDNAETLRQLLPWSRVAKPRLPLPVETTTTGAAQ